MDYKKLRGVDQIDELEDIEFDTSSIFTLPSRDLGTVELSSISQDYGLDFTMYPYLLLQYNKTAMFVHVYDILTGEIKIKSAKTRMYILVEE